MLFKAGDIVVATKEAWTLNYHVGDILIRKGDVLLIESEDRGIYIIQNLTRKYKEKNAYFSGEIDSQFLECENLESNTLGNNSNKSNLEVAINIIETMGNCLEQYKTSSNVEYLVMMEDQIKKLSKEIDKFKKCGESSV